MEVSFFRPCALMIERSSYTQSKHNEYFYSSALIVLRLIVTAVGNCTSRVNIMPFINLLQLFVAFGVEGIQHLCFS